ncbi:MAG: hypothetical protein IJM64_08660 [Ottowia sp.]|nr:hypothetical protein [Ottowia sp.]
MMTFPKHGSAKIVSEYIVREMGQECPFKTTAQVSMYWAIGIDSLNEVYMASQSTIGKRYLETQGKGDHHLALPRFKHFKFVHTGGAAADKAKTICISEARKIIAAETDKMRRSSACSQPAFA